MRSYTSLKTILAEFFPLHRTLASDDHDKTLEIVGSYMPDSSSYTVETYAPLTPVWTWKVPGGTSSRSSSTTRWGWCATPRPSWR